ncbi:hypothetical protein HBB16_16625 [Pseudonocardia sp. MCCB 268]|nr:hypothetical protein [Pseudonocardia cytotoxica]
MLSLVDGPPAAIRYFGDLDAAGLRISAGVGAGRRGRAARRCARRPACTGALLLRNRPHPAPTVDHSDVDWLDPGLRETPVRSIRRRAPARAGGRRVPGAHGGPGLAMPGSTA